MQKTPQTNKQKPATHILKGKVTTITTSAYKQKVYLLSLSRVLSEQINKSMNLQSREKKCLKTGYFFVLNLISGVLYPQFSDLI